MYKFLSGRSLKAVGRPRQGTKMNSLGLRSQIGISTASSSVANLHPSPQAETAGYTSLILRKIGEGCFGLLPSRCLGLAACQDCLSKYFSPMRYRNASPQPPE